jgi:hypothetical protein
MFASAISIFFGTDLHNPNSKFIILDWVGNPVSSLSQAIPQGMMIALITPKEVSRSWMWDIIKYSSTEHNTETAVTARHVGKTPSFLRDLRIIKGSSRCSA